MNKTLNFIISEQGNSGKSYIASAMVDIFRNHFNLETAAYLLDIEQTTLLNRMGEKKGSKLTQQEDPLTGVVSYDILNQRKLPENEHIHEVKKFLKTLTSPYDHSFYDFPGQGRSALQNLFQEDELAYTLEMSNKNINIIIPVVEKKSLSNILLTKELFTFNNDFESLNDRINFYVIYNPINVKNDLPFNDLLVSPQHKELLLLGNRYEVFKHTNIDSNVLAMVIDRPFTHYYNLEDNSPQNLTDEMLEYGDSNVGIHLRRIFRNDTGFIKILQNSILKGEQK